MTTIGEAGVDGGLVRRTLALGPLAQPHASVNTNEGQHSAAVPPEANMEGVGEAHEEEAAAVVEEEREDKNEKEEQQVEEVEEVRGVGKGRATPRRGLIF